MLFLNYSTLFSQFALHEGCLSAPFWLALKKKKYFPATAALYNKHTTSWAEVFTTTGHKKHQLCGIRNRAKGILHFKGNFT